ncbi:MAG: bifunctional adenosylcobinamide kinase/adenosylcobinamide-phosphate guanylyltransferase [Candidatus Humimicrobiaceae bacterium]
MKNIYFLLGGAGSGKSSYAEELASSLSDKVAYIATAKITDIEMEKRIRAHRKRRPKNWKTFELQEDEIQDIAEIFNEIEKDGYGAVLLDCVTNLLFRILEKFDIEHQEVLSNREEKEIEEYARDFFSDLLEIIKKKNFKTVIVSNEVGAGIVPPFPLGRLFRDIMGVINKEIASQAGQVYYFIAGLKQRLK